MSSVNEVRQPGRRSIHDVAAAITLTVVALVLGGAAAVSSSSAASGDCTGTGPVVCTFGSTGAQQTFTAPAGLHSLHVVAVGGAGGALTATGGRGARVEGDLAVTPGQVLYVMVGGNGDGGGTNHAGGFNGGGAGGSLNGSPVNQNGGGGGGASDIRIGGTALAQRVLVAAGGGGAGGGLHAGAGGNAGSAGGSFSSAPGGGAATLTSGGVGGNNTDLQRGENGGLGTGGRGGVFAYPGASDFGGGGGGGGSYGGGGGAAMDGNASGGGGGGGSSTTGSLTNGSITADTSGTPSITISHKLAQATLSVTAPTNGTYKQTYAISTSGGSTGSPITFDKGSSTACTVSGSSVTITSGTGSCTITATMPGDATYEDAVSAPFAVAIAKAPLTVSADNKSIIYGADTPALSVQYSGFLPGEGVGSLGGALTYTFAGISPTVYASSTTAPVHAGGYTITPGGFTSTNYAITFVAGTYTIHPKVLATQLSWYGGSPTPNPAVAGENVTFIGSLGNMYPPPPISDTSLVVELREFGTLSSCNGSYGGSLTEQGTIDSYGQVTLHYTAGSVGAHYFRLWFQTTDSGDYSYLPSSSTCTTLTVDPAGLAQDPLYVTGPLALTYGEVLPLSSTGGSGTGALSYGVGSSTACELRGNNFYVGAKAGTGTCTVTVTKAGDGTYRSATSEPLQVGISKKGLTVTADNKTITSDQTTPAFTVRYSAFATGDSAASLGGTLTYTFAGTGETSYGPSTTAPTGVGTYSITPSGFTSGNYTFTYVAGTFRINPPAALTDTAISAVSGSGVYGGTALLQATLKAGATPLAGKTISFTLNGSSAGSAPTNATGIATLSGVDLGSLGAGTHTGAVGASFAGDSTYAASGPTTGNLMVEKTPLSVTADNKTINFGATTPTFTVSSAGFVNGETAAALNGSVTYTFAGTGSTSYGPSTTPPTHAGGYSITPAGLSSDNYEISFVAGTYTINPAGVNTQVGWYGYPSMTPNPAEVGQQVTFTAKLSKTYVAGQSDTISDTNLTVELIETNTACQPLSYHSHSDAQHIDASGSATLHYTASTPLGNHVFGLVFHQQDSGDYRYYQSSSSGCQVLNVVAAKTNQTITFTAPTNVTTDTGDFSLGATASSNLAVTYTSSTSSVCTIASGTLHVVAAGDCTVTAHQVGDATYNPAPDVERTFTIAQGKASQTIDFTAPTGAKYGDADSSLGATASSSLPVTYASSTTGICTIVEGKLHVKTAGECTIVASQDGNDSYKAAANESRTFTIGTVPLSVTADADPETVTIDGFSKRYGAADPTFTIRYAGFVNGETASVLEGTLALAFAGTGDTVYDSSTTPPSDVGTYSVTPGGLSSSNYELSFVAGVYEIGKARQTISFTAPSGVSYGDLVWLSGSTDSGLRVEYESSTPTVCSVAEKTIVAPFAPMIVTPVGPSLIISGTGDCTIVASQPGDDNYDAADSVTHTFAIGKASLSVTADDATKSYGKANPSFTVSYNGFVNGEDASVLGGTLAFDTTATTTSPVGTYDVTPKGLTSDNYDVHFVVGTLTIEKASQSITFTAPSNVRYGDSDSSLGASASSGLAVSYGSSTASVCTIVSNKLHVVAAGDCTITASQEGDGNFEAAAAVEKTFAIGQASQTITFTPPTGVKYGDPDSGLGATASSGLAVSYASSTTGICTIVSGELHVVMAGNCTITASQAGNVNYAAATDVTKTFTIGKSGQTITFAPLPGKTYGDPDFTVSATASSGLAVTFAAGGTCEMADATTVHLTGVGSCTITASQAGNDNYRAADDVQRTFSVGTAEGVVNYIGQSLVITSGPNSTTAKVALTASVQGDAGDITNARVTFTDDVTHTVLAKGVPVTAVQGGSTLTGTANTFVTLSSGKYGAESYLIRVRLDPASGSWYDNDDQIADPQSAEAAYATVTVMVPGGTNTAKGHADLTPLAPAGSYAAGTNVDYTIGLKYNKGGSSPQGQILLTFDLGVYRYYVKSNSITSLACTKNANTCRDLTIYTKASIYRVNELGITTSVDGNVTLRVDLHDAGNTSTGDTIGFTVLSSKNSTLYYSNNWTYDTTAKAWRTVQQPVNATDGLAVVIN